MDLCDGTTAVEKEKLPTEEVTEHLRARTGHTMPLCIFGAADTGSLLRSIAVLATAG